MHNKLFSATSHGQTSRSSHRRSYKAAIPILAACAVLMLTPACMSVKYVRSSSDGEKIDFATTSFFTKKQIKDVDYGVTRNGSRKFRLKGYANDQTEVINSAVSAALQAYISGQQSNQRPPVTPP